MAAVVAGAGSLLGGWAASKLMGTPKAPPPGGGTPGLTTSTGTKSKGGAATDTAVQIDPAQVIAFYEDAAKVQQAGWEKGLDFYKQAMTLATGEVKAAFKSANETLQPLSWSSNQALNQQMRMMGLDPISSTINAPQHAVEAGYSADLSKQISDANKMKDPTERQAAFNNINDQMKAIYDKPSTYEADLAAMGPRPQTWYGAPILKGGIHNQSMRTSFNSDQDMLEDSAQYDQTKEYQWGYDPANAKYLLSAKKLQFNAAGQKGNGQTGYEYDKGMITRDQLAAEAYDAKLQRLQSEEEARKALLPGQQAFAAQYNNDFTQEYDKGFTGDEVTHQIESTPGYGAIVDAGTKAIERQGAAKHMLGSANTEVALQKFGQGTAQSYYTSYMDNLNKIVNEGSGATMQVSANQVAEGGMLANIQQLGGQAAMDTWRGIGTYAGDVKQAEGAQWANIAMANANLQQKQFALNTDRSAQESKSAANASASKAANTSANSGMISAIGGL